MIAPMPRFFWLLPVALALAACAPPAAPPPPVPGTPAYALHGVRTGNRAGLARALAKDAGLCMAARSEMARLDPEAWLVFFGARWREHDLRAAVSATTDDGMRHALGFGDDALVSTLLRAPSRLSEKLAGGRRYFQTVDPPLTLTDDLPLEGCSGHWLAVCLKYKADLSGRLCVARIGFAGAQMTELDAGEDIGEPPSLDAALPAYPSPRAALQGAFAPLGELLPAPPPRARSLELAALDTALNLYYVVFIARAGQWQLVTALRSTQTQRLERAQDEALRVIHEAALAFERREARWPAKQELGLRAAAWVDPSAKRGWSVYESDAPAGFELAAKGSADEDFEVARALSGAPRILRSGRVVR